MSRAGALEEAFVARATAQLSPALGVEQIFCSSSVEQARVTIKDFPSVEFVYGGYTVLEETVTNLEITVYVRYNMLALVYAINDIGAGEARLQCYEIHDALRGAFLPSWMPDGLSGFPVTIVEGESFIDAEEGHLTILGCVYGVNAFLKGA